MIEQAEAQGANRAATSDTRSVRRPVVLLWGPFPHRNGVFGGGIGGYARANSEMMRTWLADRFGFRAVRMTVPRFAHPWVAAAYMLPRMAADVLTIVWAVLRRRPDVLHITALYWRSIYREAFAVAWCRAMGVRTLYDVRAGTLEDFWRGGGVGLRLLRYILRHADEVVVEGQRYVPFLREKAGVAATWAPNFVRDEVLAEVAAAPLVEPGEGEPLRLVFVGYLLPDKGVDVLLAAAERLGRRRAVRLTLVGVESPAIHAELVRARSLRSPSFELVTTGRLEFAQVLETLREQHVFVFLSRFFGEGHANAVNEAMAAGLPILVSDHGFLADVVTGACGRVLEDARDVEAVVAALEGMTADWRALQAMGRASRLRVERSFTDGVVLATYADVYRRLLERPPSDARPAR